MSTKTDSRRRGPEVSSGKSLGRIVAVPSLWPRPGGVLNSTGWAFYVKLPHSANFQVERYLHGTGVSVSQSILLMLLNTYRKHLLSQKFGCIYRGEVLPYCRRSPAQWQL